MHDHPDRRSGQLDTRRACAVDLLDHVVLAILCSTLLYSVPFPQPSWLHRTEVTSTTEIDVTATIRTPRVSVCMPVYNALPLIESTIESVLAQTFTDFEILIRDDGSIDGTREWLEERYGGDPRFRLRYNSQNYDVGGQYNLLFHEARGDYILKLDADDIILPNLLARLVAQAERLDADFVGAAYEWLDMTDGSQRRPASQEELMDGLLEDAARAILIDNPYSLCFSIWRRSLLPAIERDGQYVLHTETCDWEAQLRMALAGARFATVTDVLGLYRLHGHNRSSRPQRQLRSVVRDTLPYWFERLELAVGKATLGDFIKRLLAQYLRGLVRGRSALDREILIAFARLLGRRPRRPDRCIDGMWRRDLIVPPSGYDSPFSQRS
ncbi:MAG: glycosyltransferase family 2 protein [Alphaproteobacteria bacterium]|nr:MAG: glycosyltransferase family 2 protein [Alphaproteobacteria bacterium]